jgi:uncharacterized membrane protein
MFYESATTVALIVYTILGIAMLVAGRVYQNNYTKILGGVLLGGVITRLLLIDVWQMDIVGRIITFFVIGLLLISTAFLGKKSDTQLEN